MYRALLFAFGAVVTALVVIYLVNGNPRYLRWARILLIAGLGLGLGFFLVMLALRIL